MSNLSRLRRSLSASLALLTISASSLFAAEPSLDRLLPGDTAVVVGWRDMPALNARFPDSSFGRAWADPQISRFFAPLLEHPALKEFLGNLSAQTGLTLEEILTLPTGDVFFAIPKIDFNADQPSLLFALEVGEKQARVAEVLKSGGDKDGVTVAYEDYNGVELGLVKFPAEDPDAEPVTRSVWALHQGRWFIGSDRAAVVGALDALAAGGLTNSLAESPDYVRLLDRAKGSVGMLAQINVRAIYPGLLATAEAARGAGGQSNMFGIEPVTVMKALGLDVIEGLSMVSSHRDDTDYLAAAFTYSENRGLVRLLAYKDGPVAKPDWLPASWFNVSSQNFSIADFYAELEKLLDGVSPLLVGMAQGQLKTFERQLGVDFKRDLIGSIGESFVSGFVDPAGASAERATPYDELDQFVGVSLADAAAFERTLETLKGAFLPPGDASPLKARDYLGRTIHSFASPIPGGKGVSYSISDGWLFLSIGSAGPIESAIQLQATPNNDLAFWRRADVRAGTEGAPSGAVSLQYSELAPIFASLASFVVKLQENEGDEDMRFVDPAALPSRELLARYLKHGTGYVVRTPEGLLFHSEGPSK